MKSSPSVSERMSVFLSNDSGLSCEILALALRRCSFKFNVVGCVSDSREFVRSLSLNAKPQVVLVSARLDDGDLAGLRVVREIRTHFPTVPVILLVDQPDRELIINAFRAGVKGTFSRKGHFEDLCKCISQVGNGQIWATTDELQMVLEALASAPPLRIVDAKGMKLLTKRQQQVSMLVADGLTNREVANRLKLSEHTVRNYLFRIFDKLGVSSRTELILYATSSERLAEREQPAA